ncbi:MAG TPA: hypothetical protein VNT42_00010 [Sphingomonas sp.]|nr:hypothetical protein [Sphingomonas sp.]
MASAAYQKKGLTTFGWLALGGAAAAYLSNKGRRDNLLNSARDLAGKFGGGSGAGQSAPGSDNA